MTESVCCPVCNDGTPCQWEVQIDASTCVCPITVWCDDDTEFENPQTLCVPDSITVTISVPEGKRACPCVEGSWNLTWDPDDNVWRYEDDSHCTGEHIHFDDFSYVWDEPEGWEFPHGNPPFPSPTLKVEVACVDDGEGGHYLSASIWTCRGTGQGFWNGALYKASCTGGVANPSVHGRLIPTQICSSGYHDYYYACPADWTFSEVDGWLSTNRAESADIVVEFTKCE